jgi:hypothetical protein
MRHARGVQLIPVDVNALPKGDLDTISKLTFADLMEWERLGGRCCRCEHHGLVNRYQMRKFGKRPLIELEPWLRCVVCNNKGDNRWVITKLDRNV